MKFPRRHTILLVLLLLVAALYRFYALRSQGLICWDEAYLYNRAWLLRELFLKTQEIVVRPNLFDIKMIWLNILGVGQIFFPGDPNVGKYISAFFGTATILLTYFFAKRIFVARSIALLSAAVLALSNYHISYSRYGLPEATSCFLSLLSMFLYLRGMERGALSIVLAGFCTILSFFINYKSGITIFSILALEIYIRARGLRPHSFGKWHFLVFLLSLGAGYLAYEVFLILLTYTKIYMASQLAQMLYIVRHHSVVSPELFSFLTFPFYIGLMDGPGMLLLFVVSVLFLKKKDSPLLPLALTLIPMAIFVYSDEPGPRALCPALPFIAMTVAVSLYYFYKAVEKTWLGKAVFWVFVLILILTGMTRPYSIIHFRSGIKAAVAMMQARDPKAMFVAVNHPIVNAYAPQAEVIRLDMADSKELWEIDHSRHSYIILDPQIYIISAVNGWNTLPLNPLVGGIYRRCQPLAEFDHFDEPMHRWFTYEHNKKGLRKTSEFLEKITPSDRKVKVYAARECLETLLQK